MKRFSFRLQTLLDMKKRREEGLARSVAEKNNEIMRAFNNLRKSRDHLSQFQIEEKKQREIALDPLRLRFSIAHRHAVQREIEECGIRIVALRQDLQTAVHSLTEAKKETRALEILRDKKRTQWKRDYAREEQEIADDVSQNSHGRKSNSSLHPHG